MMELNKTQLLDILVKMDTGAFRTITECPDSVTHNQILEAMHITRTEHKGINRKLRRESARWLLKNIGEDNDKTH